jgi:hypothetical protein
MRRLPFAISVVLAISCGTEPSGTLTLTVEDLPEFWPDASLDVRGTVTREPSSDTPVILTVAGGGETVQDTVGGTFNFSVPLKLNQENQLSIMAYDGTGSIADAVVVSVFHDDTGPVVVSSVPANGQLGVGLTTAIEVRYAEPLVQTGPDAAFILEQNSRPVPGTATLSGDNTLFTFQPDQSLEPASIYEMVLEGFTDEAGNTAGGTGENACFITTFDPAQFVVTQDTSSDIFQSVPPPSAMRPLDILGGTLARLGSTLYGIFEFDENRSLNGSDDAASVWLDIDVDNNPTTGFQAFKDFQFDAAFPQFNTNLGVELMVALDGHLLSDSGFVGVNTDDVEWTIIDRFQPGVCGRRFGFHTTMILGDSIQDDGNFGFAYTAFAVEDSVTGTGGAWGDPVPLSGSFTANLLDPGLSASRTIPLPTRRVWPPVQVEAPLIRMLQLLQGR